MRHSIYQVCDEIWCVDELMTIEKGFFPFALPRFLATVQIRMTVVQLSNQRLLIHSPVCPTAEIVRYLNNLGEVAFIIAPNVMHTKYTVPFSMAYPNAKVFVALKAFKRRIELKNFPTLDDKYPVANEELQQCLFNGHRSNETVFFHPNSKTLIVSDLAYNFSQQAPFITKCFMKIFKAYGGFALPTYHKKFVRDKKQLADSINHICSWDFERVIMSHGSILNNNGNSEFKRIWSWVYD